MEAKDFKIHLVDKSFVSPLFESVIREELKDVTVNDNEVKLHTFYIEDKNDKYETCVCIINAVQRSVDFRDVLITIIDSNNNICGQQHTDLTYIGIMPAYSITPITLNLTKSSFNIDIRKASDYKVAFLNNIIATTSNKITKIIIDETFDATEARVIEKFICDQTTVQTNDLVLEILSPNIKNSVLTAPLIILNNSGRNFDRVNAYIGLIDELGRLKAKKDISDIPLSIHPHCGYAAKIVFTDDDIYENIEALVNYKSVIFSK